MKIFKQIVATIMILILIGTSAAGMFSLSSAHIDNRKANVAVVNEDNGIETKTGEVKYGIDFVKLLGQNADGNYKVTSRVAAQEGLNDGKYDLVIIVPKNFTEKAITYNSNEPEPTFLEYSKSPRLSQSEGLKADVVSKILKETANKTLIQTFTLEVLKTMQGMQEKSLHIIDNEVKYQKTFKDNVEKPMSDAMTSFNSNLGELASQQGLLGHFDSSVKGFDEGVKAQTEAENKHAQDLAELRKQYEESTSVFTKWSTDYNETIKSMTSDKYRTAMLEAQKAGALSIEDMINNLKMNAVRIEFQIKQLEEYKSELEKLKAAYDSVAVNGLVEGQTDPTAQKVYEQLKPFADRVDDLLKNDNESSKGTVKTSIQGVKDHLEDKIKGACEEFTKNTQPLSSNYAAREEAVNQLCGKQGNKNTPSPSQTATVVEYTQTTKHILPETTTVITTNSLKNGDNNTPKITASYKRLNSNDKAISMQNGDNKITDGGSGNIEVTVTLTYTKTFPQGTNVEMTYTPSDADAYKETVTIKDGQPLTTEMKFSNITGVVKNKEETPGTKKLEQLVQVESLAKLYYGKTVSDLIESSKDGKNKHVFPSDEGIDLAGIKKYRGYANQGDSVIAKLETVLSVEGKNTLKTELIKAVVQPLKANVDDVIKHLNDYIAELQKLTKEALNTDALGEEGIYEDAAKTKLREAKPEYYIDRNLEDLKSPEDKSADNLNVTIAKMKTRQTGLTEISKNLEAYDTEFQGWLQRFDTISGNVENITQLNESEGKISIQLDTNQKQLLTSLEGLQKSVDGQLESTKEIITNADKLKTETEDSKKKIEENTKKLEDTKKKFDDTVKNNSDFVNDFVRKYVSAQSGGADNVPFYDNYANPVKMKEKEVYNSNSLIPFFIILMTALFAFLIAHFFSNRRYQRLTVSEHGGEGMFAGLTLQLLLVVITGVLAAGIVSYIGLEAISKEVNINIPLVVEIIIAGLLTLAFVFYLFMLQFKKTGTAIVAGVIGLYFVTNGALGLSLVKNENFAWLRFINPLVYLEQAIQNIILNQNVALRQLVLLLFSVTVVAIVAIYIVQPFVYRRKEKKTV